MKLNNRLLAVPLLLVCTVSDMIMMGGVFNHGNDLKYFSAYYTSAMFLSISFVILLAFAARSFWLAVYSIIALYGGWLDILFYWFQGLHLPENYSWLFAWKILGFTPTGTQLLLWAVTISEITIIIDLVVSHQRLSNVPL